jgi:hypothetical protein
VSTPFFPSGDAPSSGSRTGQGSPGPRASIFLHQYVIYTHVALIKIDVPDSVPMVRTYDSYSESRPGDVITVLGYPGISGAVPR